MVSLLGEYRETPLLEGVAGTIGVFREAIADGRIARDSLN
jgi:hypothetical protein